MKPLKCALTVVLILVAVSPLWSTSEPQLFIDASITFNRENTYIAVYVVGKVFDEKGIPVGNAEVSIQVNDPHESSVHVALIHSDINGSYTDSFRLSLDTPLGEYSVYMTASKPGFQDGFAQLSFQLTAPELILTVEPIHMRVEQGGFASFTVAVEAGYNVAVYLNLTGLPEHSRWEVAPNPVRGGSSANLTIFTSPDTPSNTYNLTISGSSGVQTKHIKVTLTVTPAHRASPLYVIVVLTLAAASFTAFYARRFKGGKKTSKPSLKKYYLEGLPLDSEILMNMPDHLRKTALTLCNLGEATAEDISNRTGRARAVESDYLNQLVNLGHVKKKRKGRRVYFYIPPYK
ncbi:MAG: helix-turn-helix domain-containing protein [Thermoproteota archaeon]